MNIFAFIKFNSDLIYMRRLIVLFLSISAIYLSACKKEQECAPEDLPAIEAHSTVIWQKMLTQIYYNENNHLDVYGLRDHQNMTISQDSNIAVFFATYHDGDPHVFFDFIKLDSEGNELFVKSYSLQSGEYPDKASVINTTDNGFLLFYNYFSINHTLQNSRMVKTDQDGNTLWEKDFSFWPKATICCIIEKQDGGFLGVVRDSTRNILFKLTASGDTAETAILPPGINFNSVALQLNGNIILAGNHLVEGMHSNGDVMSIDGSANIIWHNVFEGIPGINYLNFFGVTVNADNSLALVGNYTQSGLATPFFVKYNSSGEILSELHLNSNNACEDIEPAPGSGYFLLSRVYRQLVKISESGEIEWMQTLVNYPDYFVGLTIKRTGNDYLAFGFFWPPESYYSHGFLIKFSVY